MFDDLVKQSVKKITPKRKAGGGFSAQLYHCPKCGYMGENFIMFSWIETGGLKTKKKLHCFDCYYKWIADNVPELDEVL